MDPDFAAQAKPGNSTCLLAFLLLLPLVFQACATLPAPRTATFQESEYQPYAGTGEASVSGQVSMKAGGGQVTSGGGCKEVLLEPVTSYSTEWFEREIVKHEALGTPDPRALSFRRTAQTDATGSFRFEKLPAGSYYVACLMQWDRWIMQGTRPVMFEEDVWVHGRLTLRPGEHGRIVLSP
jgi:uncharacterized protein YodC (DUF2158 family)